MSLFKIFVKIFRAGETVKTKPCLQEEAEKLPAGEELLLKKREFLKRKIEQECVLVRKNYRKKEVALQALKRKKWYEKHLQSIDCAVKAVRSAQEHMVIVNKANALIKNITEEQEDVAKEMSKSLYTSVSSGAEFDEDELLADPENLEKYLDEILFEDKTEEKVPCYEVSPTASPSYAAKTEEDGVEDALEYLRRWAK